MSRPLHTLRWSRRALGALLVLALGTLAGACGEAPTPVHHRQFLAFGTLIEVSIAGTDADTAARAMDAVEQEFRYMDDTWSPNRPNALARVNQLLATGEWFSVAPSVRPLIVRSQALYDDSEGLFNPAMGELIHIWGFDQDERPPGPPPPAEQIAAWVRAAPGMDDIELDGIRIRSRNPHVRLDFGGFAKGYGVDIAIARLRELGITDAIVNAGGDLRAIGRHGRRPWNVGVRHPRREGMIALIQVEGDEAVVTSGDYERYFEWEGRRYHHILDPRTGYPARGTTSVTVLHRDAGTADAAATALFIAGPGEWPRIARRMGVDRVMLVDSDGGVHLSPAMARRIRWQGAPPEHVSVEELPPEAGA